MNKWQVADLEIDVDAVLRGQGADPDIIRQRSPRLMETAQEALELGISRLEPQVLVEEFKVVGVGHDRLQLDNGKDLKGPLVTGHLVGATCVTVALCTVGSSIDELAAETMEDDIVKGLAVDGVGSAAVEALANAVCREIEQDAAERGLETTIPLSPGMIGWGVDEGQQLIFDLVDSEKQNIKLTPSYLMVPRKSISMVMGIGPNINSGARICDFCAMRDNCRYQDHFESSQG